MTNSRRIAAMDLQRIMAAVAVMMYHDVFLFPYGGDSPLSDVSDAVRVITQYGYLGVEVFFMISGYVIAMSVEGRNRAQFAYARFVRLWPTFVICLGITLLVESLVGRPVESPVAIIGNLTMIPHLLGLPYVDTPYWSLMFEILFYAAIMVFVISPQFVMRLRFFTIVWITLAIVQAFIPVPKLKVILVLDYAPYFAVGISVFLFRRSRSIPDLGLLLTSITTATVFATLQARNIGAPFPIHPVTWISGAIVGFAAVLMYWMPSVQVGPRVARISFVLGGISYPLYLLHSKFGRILAVDLIPGSGILAFTVSLPIVFGVCYAVWYIEPLLKRLLDRMTAAFPAIAA